MIVTQRDFLDFLGTEGLRLSIPAYQRLYSWSETQCEELWLDLMRAGRLDRNHFLGTVLYAADEAAPGLKAHSIIDGQQRVTSVSLIILALSRYLDAHPLAGTSGAALKERYLLTRTATGDTRVRFVPSPHDRRPYFAELDSDETAVGASDNATSAISSNLAFFASKMEADGFDPHVLLRGLDRLTVVLVEVEDAQAAQPIFESINSKGMPLNVADMIRNYLLLAESHDEQTRLYEEYWQPSQEMFSPDPGSLKLNTGLKSWLSIRLKGARVRSPEQVYSSFKRYVEDTYQGAKEPILRELRGFCLMWAENYRYHGVKKYRSGSNWAEIGAPTLTAGYELKQPTHKEYAQKLRAELSDADARW